MKPKIAKLLEALGAETAEDRQLAEKRAKQKEALDYYRKHGEPPLRGTPLGWAWAVWVANGDHHDPEFVKAARALGWLPQKEKTAARKKEALYYYREHGEPPYRKTPLGSAWNVWTTKGERHDPEFVKDARALGWLPSEERIAVQQKVVLDYYRKNGESPHWKTSLGAAFNRWISKGSDRDPKFVKALRALGWKPREERTSSRQKEALDYYHQHGKPPSLKTSLGAAWSRWVSKSEGYNSDFVKKARALGWKPKGEK